MSAEMSRGVQLLIGWRESKGLTQAAACAHIGLDPAIYNAFEKARKRPGLKRAALIEVGTDGAVPSLAWSQPPRVERKGRRAA